MFATLNSVSADLAVTADALEGIVTYDLNIHSAAGRSVHSLRGTYIARNGAPVAQAVCGATLHAYSETPAPVNCRKCLKASA